MEEGRSTELFVDNHNLALVQRVKNIEPILDGLFSYKVINREHYEEILSLHGPREKMRALLSGPLRVCGPGGKEIFYKLLRTHESDLLDDLADESEKYKKNKKDMEVQSMMAQKILLESLNDLSSDELNQFKSLIELEESFPLILRGRLKAANTDKTVDLMVKTFSGKCVNMTKTVLKTMNRTDLVQRLSDISSGTKEEPLPSLIQSVQSMMAQKILLESLNDLSSDELNQFKSLIELEESFPLILRGRLKAANTDKTVDLMVKTFSGKCVNMTKTVLKTMNRTDLVQRLSDISSGTKEEPLPSLIQSVETTVSVIELLLETLKDLSDQDLYRFKMILSQILPDKDYLDISPSWLMMRDRQDMVFYLVQDHSQHRLLEMIPEAFEKMNRTDLVQRLSQSSSGPKKKHSEAQRPAVIQKVATMAAVKHLLLETLNDLRNEDLEKFKQSLDLIVSKKKPRYFSWILRSSAGRSQTVKQMMEIFGQQCVEITMEVLKDINRTDLRQRLTNLELKEMYSVDEHRPAQSEGAQIAAVKPILLKTLKQVHLRLVDRMVETCGPQSVEVTREVLMDMDRTDLVERLSETILRLKDKHPSKPPKEEVTVASLEEKLLETLEDLSHGELEKFKRGLQRISSQRLETAGRVEIVDLMVEIYGQQSMEVTMEILKKMKEDYGLEQKLSNITLGSKGASRSLDLEGIGKITKDSSGWTKLEPEVNSTDEDEASTYSLKSEAGNFECSVSGLRWVCQDKVSFKYQFCSSEEPMKRMEMMKYMLAGPLIDITVISGNLFEVYLPHWICIDDIPKILQKFAVLHIDDCGDVVEKVSEVTSSHVKLPSTRTIKEYKFIRKPRPNKDLKMHQDFNLTAGITAEICPEKITLSNGSQSQRSIFFDVHFKNPISDFNLTLSQLNKGKRKPQWSHKILKVELRNSGDSDEESTGGPSSENESRDTAGRSALETAQYTTVDGEHFVDEHRTELIKRVNCVADILDQLLDEKVITPSIYDEIMEIRTTQKQMRELFSGPLKSAGPHGKDVFYRILEKEEKCLIDELKGKK
ncbi:hypothetical protein JOQ06_025826 [Pogonophryne albipinna]|uniref:CARD domain-containing protein n=1 Tax=Pogonophryne albipinna TaxID=1090488 RepID=A0AAD6AVI5_9TELE|nr:hypothetical protein JOQ06_025826 [Pogonophryne albipinna]